MKRIIFIVLCSVALLLFILAGIASSLMEKEYEHEQSEEYFLDHAECNEWEFKENGGRL